jgi:hypothetical protein
MVVILVLGGRGRWDHKFEASLGYIVRTFLKKKKKETQNNNNNSK